MNLRFKCLDSRDDFAAQMKKKIPLPFMDGGILTSNSNNLDNKDSNLEGKYIGDGPDVFYLDDLISYGPRNMRKNVQRLQINTLLFSNRYFSNMIPSPFIPCNIHFEGSKDWWSIIKTYVNKSCHNTVIESSTPASNWTRSIPHTNDIRVVTLQHIRKTLSKVNFYKNFFL